MLTPLGKIVRKLRIDDSVTMKDMADSLGLSVAFISAVETGRKSPSKQLVDGLIKFFQLGGPDADRLKLAAEESQQEYRIRLDRDASDERRSTAAALARNFDELPDERLKELRETILRSRL